MKQLLFLVMILITGSVWSADSGSGSDSSDSTQRLNVREEMNEARALLKAMKYKAAARKLDTLVRQDYQNADAWNLLGYSNRKLGRYGKAGKAYVKALKYDPEHKGALEYQGELFIKQKRFSEARVNLEKLTQLCPNGCEELLDLEQALASAQ